MKFSIVSVLAFASSALAGLPSTLAWDEVYSSPSTSTLSLACSDGANGLYTKGYKTLGAIPGFPNVAASPEVAGWNSPQCGACYKLYYSGTGKIVYVTAVDVGRGSFVGSKQVLDTLTNGRAVEVGRVDVSYLKVDRKFCGFS